MSKGLLKVAIIFFMLCTHVNAEAGLVDPIPSWTIGLTTDAPRPIDAPQNDDIPADAEEDTTETREIDEYDNVCSDFRHRLSAQLLNLHYTYQHLLFKEHFADAVVPPPKA